MDWKEKLKKSLKKGLNSASSATQSITGKSSAFAGTGRRLGTVEAPPPQQRPAPSAAPAASPSRPSSNQNSAPPTQPRQPPAPATLPSPPPLPGAAAPSLPSPAALSEPSVAADYEPSEAIQSAVDLFSTDAHCSTSAPIVYRILNNIVSQPDDTKFRKIRLGNPKIQAAVVDTHGGVELLLACGFHILFETTPVAANAAEDAAAASNEEGYAVLDPEADLHDMRAALSLLRPLMPPAAAPAAVASTAAAATAERGQESSAQPAQPQPPQQAQQLKMDRNWETPRPRSTTVVLPNSVDQDVPDWFFARTGGELKAAFLAAVKRREEGQVLMTKAMREKFRLQNAGPGAGARHAVVKIRLPEGICLQGEFGGGEPAAAVFAWTAECLCDPLQTFDLVLPDRSVLETAGQGGRRPLSVREAGLLPSVTLNLRWTLQSAVEMRGVPALRKELLQQAANAQA